MLSTYVESYKKLWIPLHFQNSALRIVVMLFVSIVDTVYTHFILPVQWVFEHNYLQWLRGTLLGASNANCCSTSSILFYEKHRGQSQLLFLLQCKREKWWEGSHSTWLSWRRGWELIQQHPLLLSQEERAVLYSKLYDSSAWVWDHSKFNGNIAGGRLELCRDNAGNDGWHKTALVLYEKQLVKRNIFL